MKDSDRKEIDNSSCCQREREMMEEPYQRQDSPSVCTAGTEERFDHGVQPVVAWMVGYFSTDCRILGDAQPCLV
jgi:hypothetical protein